MNKILRQTTKNYNQICDNFFSFHLQWHITNQCNFRCKHCYQENYSGSALSFTRMKEIFADFLKIISGKKAISPFSDSEFKLSIVGGEPMLYKHFDKLMKEISAKKQGFRLSLLSNGSLLNNRALKKIFNQYKFDSIQISLEGMEKNNDAIRGKGSFHKAVAAIERIVKMNKVASISLTLNRQNYEDLPAILKLGYDLGVPVGIKRLVLQGQGRKIKNLFLSPEELLGLYKYLIEINSAAQEKTRGNFAVYLGCESGLTAQFGYPGDVWQPGFCSAMTAGVLTPLPDGTVYSCRRLPIALGNLSRESLFDIYKRVAAGQYRLDMEKMPKKCQRCEHFPSCFGGSRCVSYGYFGNKDLYSPDPQCFKLFPSR